MLAVVPRPVEPCALVLDTPDAAVCGDRIPFALTVRNLGTVPAETLVVSLAIPADVRLVEASESCASCENREATFVVGTLAPGAIARIVGAVVTERGSAVTTLAFTATVTADGTVVGAVGREIALAAAPVEKRMQADDARSAPTIDDVAMLAADVASAEPGERIAWSFDVALAGGIADDYTIDLHGLGCDVELASVRATYGGGTIVVPTTRRDAVVTARVAAICGTGGLRLDFVAVVASPHVRGGTVAVEATVARGRRHRSASASVTVDAAARFASVPETIALLEPLHAGRTSRLAIAVVNVGTACVNGVRVAGSLEGIDGCAVHIAKGTLDDIAPFRTEIVDGRIIVPSPLRNGTLVTVTASISANACEPATIRRVFAVASSATFAAEDTFCRLVGHEPVRPYGRRTLHIAATNTGTDRATDARVRLALPSWLRLDGAPDDERPERALGTIEAGASAEQSVDLCVAAHAPMGTHDVFATLLWDDGRIALAPAVLCVETRPAFDEAMLVLDDACVREPDDTIAYTLSFTNTGDGVCRELCVRADMHGPAAYARASLTVNGRRVRDVGGSSALFGAGIVLEEIPVGATIVCAWRTCVDADVAASATVTCAVELRFDDEATVTLQAADVRIEPAQAFPSVASALPARLPHAAVVRAPVACATSTIAEAPRASIGPDDAATERILREYLERVTDVRGISALLDIRVFLPLRDGPSEGDPHRAAATRAVIRAIDRASIRIRLGDAACTIDTIATDLAAASTRYRDELAGASMATILLAVLDDLGVVPGTGHVRDAFAAFRDGLKAVFGWWQTRPDEIDELLNAELPASLTEARRGLIAVLGSADAAVPS